MLSVSTEMASHAADQRLGGRLDLGRRAGRGLDDLDAHLGGGGLLGLDQEHRVRLAGVVEDADRLDVRHDALIRSRCGCTGSMSLTPVTLAVRRAGSVTRPAPTGSVTAVKTIGVVGVGLDDGLRGRRGDAEDQVELLAGELLGDAGGRRHVALGVLHVVGDVGEALLGEACLNPATAASSAGCVTIWVMPILYALAAGAGALLLLLEPLELLPQPARTPMSATRASSASGTASLIARGMVLLSRQRTSAAF